MTSDASLRNVGARDVGRLRGFPVVSEGSAFGTAIWDAPGLGDPAVVERLLTRRISPCSSWYLSGPLRPAVLDALYEREVQTGFHVRRSSAGLRPPNGSLESRYDWRTMRPQNLIGKRNGPPIGRLRCCGGRPRKVGEDGSVAAGVAVAAELHADRGEPVIEVDALSDRVGVADALKRHASLPGHCARADVVFEPDAGTHVHHIRFDVFGG